MKKVLAVISVVCAIAAHGANQYNSSLGSFALEGADNCNWNISLGAASMMGATNVNKSVFLGNRAGQNTLSVSNCVGIGWGALRNKAGTERATDINGQFTADKTADTVRFYSDPDSLPVASYSNGLWRMSGDLLIEGRVSVSNRMFTGSEFPLVYDFYVDARYGDDENDGLSVLTPKQTLDAALNLVTNDSSTVCVRAGQYTYPEYFKKGLATSASGVNATHTAHKVNLVGVDGAENTVIANDGDGPAWVSGYPYGMMTLQGLTFTGFNGAPSDYARIVCPFVFVRLVDCIFRDTTTNVSRYKTSEAIFDQCVLENCKMRDCHFTAPKNQGVGNENGYYYNIVISLSLVHDCDIRYSSARVSDTDWECTAIVGTELIDTYLQTDVSRVQPKRTWNGQLTSFSDGCIYNSTVLIENISGNNSSTRYFDSIFGYGGNGTMTGSFTDCYTNSVSGVNNILGYDKKPLAQSIRDNPSLAFCGWGDESAIANKNGIVSFVAKAITDSIPAQAPEETDTALRSASARLLSSAEQALPTERFNAASDYIENAQVMIVDETHNGEDD